MARYRVSVEANSPEEAEQIVYDMIDNEEDIDYDDEGDGEIRVVEGYTEEIDENGCFKW